MKLSIAVLITLLYVPCSIAQTTKQWKRYTSISPDGSKIAFTAKGDIFIVPTKGGIATRLTAHSSHDTRPVWSHDGKKIAFASDRHGNFDVFVIDATGAALKRLTFHSSDDLPMEFSMLDDQVYFSSNRLDAPQSFLHPNLGELYSVSIGGQLPKQLMSLPVGNISVNAVGEMLFEDQKGYEDEFRKHHKSSITRDIWLKTKENRFRRLSSFDGEDRNPVFGEGSEYFYLSERPRSFNVFKSSTDSPDQITQISEFKDHPVRYLSVSHDGLLCYSYNGDIYTQRVGQQPTLVECALNGDKSINSEDLLLVNADITEMVPSSNGKEIVFVFRGDIFATSVEDGLTRRITRTPEQERNIDISPDGRSIVFAGERGNSWNLYLLTLPNPMDKYFLNALSIVEQTLISGSQESFQPKFSPDGKEVAYLEDRTKLKKIDVVSKQVTSIHDGTNSFSYADGDQHFEWSPDGKWFLTLYYPNQYWAPEIGLVTSDGTGSIYNLSKSGFYDSQPKWANNGDMVLWLSNKQGMKSVANSGPFEVDIYGQLLTLEAYEQYKLSKTEFDLMYGEASEKETKNEEKNINVTSSKVSNSKSSSKAQQPKNEEKIKIEYKGLENRKVTLSLFSASISDYVITNDQKFVCYLAQVQDKFELWKTELRNKETKSIGSFDGDGGTLRLGPKSKKLYVLNNGKIHQVDVESGESRMVEFSGVMQLDHKSERNYIFDHVTRQVKDKFLDANLHGAPWDSLVINYKQFVPEITNNYDFRDLLSEILGELNASHTGARYAHSNPKSEKTASLGIYLDPNYDGNGLKILEVIEGSPLLLAKNKIKAGVVIEAIDDQGISAGENYYPLLNRKEGNLTILTLFDPNTSERWKERVKPISLDQERELQYKRWVKRNRDMVYELSGNKLGYMHVQNMNDGSYREFYDKVMGEEQDKIGLVVDTRFNGGGDLVDDLTTFLSGEKYMTFQTKDKILGYESQRRWTKPSIMLVGESNYSDAHCAPVAYRDLGIGSIVGMPVPGTCSFVWWEKMQNGMVFGIPNMQVLDIRGDVLENKQLFPDFIVRNEYEIVVNGRDQQIETAVLVLLKETER